MRRSVARLAVSSALLALLVGPGDARGSEETVRFFATTDKERVEIGQTLTLTITVTVEDPDKVQGLVLPDPDGFRVVSTMKGVQTSFAFGSGGRQATHSTTHTMVLRAVASGVQTIPPAVMDYKGRAYRTDAVPVQVLPVGDIRREEERERERRERERSGRRGRGRSLFDDDFDPMEIFEELARQFGGDPFGGGVPGGAPPGVSPPEIADGDIFVRVGVDKEEAWLGEQITADIVIYSRYDIGGFPSPPVMPQMEGFWQEDLERPRQIRPRTQNIRGRPYRTYLLRRLALFPTRAGDLEIDPVEVNVETAMGLFAGGRSTKRRSPPVTIDVRSLPVDGRPPDFSATNVGRWDIEASLDRTSTPAGEPVTLTVSISGEGNVHAVEPPELEEIDGLRVYEPSKDQETRNRRGRFGGERTITWVIVPSRTGSFTIPSMDLHFFDPDAESYETRSTRPLTFAVTAGSPSATASAEGGARGAGANVLEADAFRTIRYGVSPSVIGPPPHRSPVVLGMMGVSAALLLGLFLADVLRRRFERAAESGKGRRAPGVAKTRMKGARKRLRAGDARGAVAESLSALQDYLCSAAGLQVRGLPRESVRQGLSKRSCPGETAESLCQLLERCESLRYSPFEPDEKEAAEVIDEIEALIHRLVSIRLDAGETK